MYTDGLLKPRHGRLTYSVQGSASSSKVKTRNAGKRKEDSIISARWAEVLYVVLFSREQTRKCTRLDGLIGLNKT